MAGKNTYEPVPVEKLRFARTELRIHDTVPATKPIGYMKDAWIRFRRNKMSVAASLIILAIFIFAVITPFINNFEMSSVDGIYAKARPKLKAFERSGFWDGGMNLRLNNRYYMYLTAIGAGAEDVYGAGVTWEDGINSPYYPVISRGEAYDSAGAEFRDARVDSYYIVGFVYVSMTREMFDDVREWEAETGINVFYPMIDTRSRYMDPGNARDANFWYRHAANHAPLNARGQRMDTIEEVMEHGFADNYLRDSEGNARYWVRQDRGMLQVRVLYYNYYQYMNGHEPMHALGADGQGYDIWRRLASGILLSFALAASVSVINLTIGAFWGAAEGYYGGWWDLIAQRICDILWGIPFIVVAALFQLHLVQTGRVSPFWGLVLAFVATGWISTSYTVRTQFYRFKNQEYILAARTLGAKDFRLMFKHIFPNAIGTIITASVLVIPSTIMIESSLSYLGIVAFNTRTTISLGTMTSNAQGFLATDPHILFWPSLIISLLMISFNLFGNGLRDAFNPSLRGTEG
ncbi:MAG: ABC transporter permease [Defluviitaleaceae bacterium]|nr:ABC transporter permease [Defluviitaleaceae bacterium]MCL2836116.1 ABC transporter permease [Defluviitaleaceae bacterium]